MAELFPPIEPYNAFRLKVGGPHELYVEECGNPQGQPVLFLHGGPGAGISKDHRRIFDPKHYRIVLFDQRGAGQSTPLACLEDNTTWDLVADIERLREKLGIEKWLVFGGSWGSTLSLAYGQTHPDRCTGLILRGIFLCRPEEIEWFYQEGCSWVYPDEWEKYIAPIPPEKRGTMVKSYYEQLTSDDETTRMKAARAWSVWEGSTVKLIQDPKVIAHSGEGNAALSLASIECHYFMNNSWLEPNQLINNVDKIRHIPTWIVHGRYDVVCPPKSAWDLHKAFPEAKFQIVADAGHAFNEPGILAALMQAVEEAKL